MGGGPKSLPGRFVALMQWNFLVLRRVLRLARMLCGTFVTSNRLFARSACYFQWYILYTGLNAQKLKVGGMGTTFIKRVTVHTTSSSVRNISVRNQDCFNPKKFYLFRSHLSSGQCELIKVQPAELPQANFPGKPPIHLIHFLTFVKDLCTPWIVSNSADLNSIVKAFCLWIKYFGRLVQIQTTVSFVGQVLSSHVCPVVPSHWPNFDAGS